MKRKSVTPHVSSFTSDFPCMITIALTLVSGATFAHGQGRRGRGSSPITNQTVQQTQNTDRLDSMLDQTKAANGDAKSGSNNDREETCFLPPLNGVHSVVVEVADLQVPPKAQQDYQDGCAAVKNSKMEDAEKHLRKVVKGYPTYPAAWVLLGQVLQVRQKTEEARDACSRPLSFHSNYLPAYLCLSDISAGLKNWDEVLKHSIRALEIDPNNGVACEYSARANLKLHHLADAEKSALRAVLIDSNHSKPWLYYLLAQVYAAKGDRDNTVAQLREYLKFVTDPTDAAMAKNFLAKLEDGK